MNFDRVELGKAIIEGGVTARIGDQRVIDTSTGRSIEDDSAPAPRIEEVVVTVIGCVESCSFAIAIIVPGSENYRVFCSAFCNDL